MIRKVEIDQRMRRAVRRGRDGAREEGRESTAFIVLLGVFAHAGEGR